MNHVHLGIDVDAARNWDPSWVKDGPPSPPKLDEIPIGDDMYLAYQILKPTGHGAFLTNGVICAPILNDDLASLRKDPKVVYAQLSQAAHDNIQKQCDEARKA